jgi:hypothetical protein
MTSEDEFRGWVINLLNQQGGHTQRHEDRNSVGIPDLSVAWGGLDYWLELKYGEFLLDTDRGYDKFEYKEVTRQQLEWLRLREAAGDSVCGILGYFRAKPTLLFHYISFMTPGIYLEKCWRTKGTQNVAGAMLSPYTISADHINTPGDLTQFILHARVGTHVQREQRGG